jgi:hypothetical protein
MTLSHSGRIQGAVLPALGVSALDSPSPASTNDACLVRQIGKTIMVVNPQLCSLSQDGP